MKGADGMRFVWTALVALLIVGFGGTSVAAAKNKPAPKPAAAKKPAPKAESLPMDLFADLPYGTASGVEILPDGGLKFHDGPKQRLIYRLRNLTAAGKWRHYMPGTIFKHRPVLKIILFGDPGIVYRFRAGVIIESVKATVYLDAEAARRWWTDNRPYIHTYGTKPPVGLRRPPPPARPDVPDFSKSA